jgi:hypothetical protein
MLCSMAFNWATDRMPASWTRTNVGGWDSELLRSAATGYLACARFFWGVNGVVFLLLWGLSCIYRLYI